MNNNIKKKLFFLINKFKSNYKLCFNYYNIILYLLYLLYF